MRALRNIPRGMAQALTSHRPRAQIHSLCHHADKAAQLPPTITTRPYIGVIAVLLGSVISTLDSRITSFGLADVEGAVHAGFDEGAWITTALTVGQMMVGPVSAWLGMVFGTRRILIISCSVFAISNLLLPFSPSLNFVLAYQFVSSLSSGTFIPLTIGFVVQSLPPRMVVYEVAAYSINLELSLNIAGLGQGLVRHPLVVALDFLGHVSARAAHAGLCLFRCAAPSREPRAAQDRRLVGDPLRKLRLQPALCRPRSGQSPGLA